jgi:glucose-6-phosphate isomerase
MKLAGNFNSNVDGTDSKEATRDIDPKETLLISCSKTFTTPENSINAHSARGWSLRKLGDDRAVRRHFVVVSTNALILRNRRLKKGSS